MIPYQKEKVENAICFFAKEHRKKTRHFLCQTFLYKYLALFDFGYLKKYGKPALGLSYRAMERGPVPIDIYAKRMDEPWSKLFLFQKDEDKFMIIPKGTPDLNYFSAREIKLMNVLIEIYADQFIDSKLMSDASHEEVVAWKRTWKKKKNDFIDLSLEFPGNIFEKSEKDLTFPEEVYLTQKGLEDCT
jgi:hypothetical protein